MPPGAPAASMGYMIKRLVLSALLILLAVASTPAASATAAVRLPAPSGPHRVGMAELRLVDHTRADPWHAEQPRELMVSVYYPARPGGRPAPYMLDAAAAHFGDVDVNDYLGLGVPPGTVDWARVRTQARLGAPADHRLGARPVLLYSPGFGEPRTWATTLVTDLASRGYVVITIDNTYESPEVQFPHGPLRVATLPGSLEEFIPFVHKALAVRTADTRFVVDQLGTIASGELAGMLDPSHIGMFGHSAGGSTAAAAMYADHRIDAGVNFDGNLDFPEGGLQDAAAHGLDRPFLLIGKDGRTDTGPGWQAFLANTPGWARQLRLIGSEHASATDAEALLPQLGLPAATLSADIGSIPPGVAIQHQSAYLAAFFDRFLLGRDNHLLDGPSAAYPWMAFDH
jgi:dienelactone hydrolase